MTSLPYLRQEVPRRVVRASPADRVGDAELRKKELNND
jgi:hypothetical protein